MSHVIQRIRLGLVASISGLAITAAQAAPIADPANDFLSTFTGIKSGDLDVLSVFATFDGVNFRLGATMNGLIGTLPTALYVFGINRGAGTSNFASLGLPGVIFDTVITMTGAGVTGGRDLVAGVPIVLPAGSAHINGNSFFIDIPGALLPSQGFAKAQYAVNLWPRDSASARPPGATSTDFQIADFAPNSTDFIVAAAPEAETGLLLGAGMLGLFGAMRARRRGHGTTAPAA